MAKRKRRRTKQQLVPRMGPPVNLRPAGAHDDKTTYDRNREKAVLRREAESGFDLSGTSDVRLGNGRASA